MRRLFFPLIASTREIRIAGEKAHYLSAVLRCRKGDEFIFFDAQGISYKAIVKGITRNEVFAEIAGVVQSDTEPLLNIVLIQGLLKGEKMDLVIQKTTELGVREIVPTITERSQVRETRKIDRWRKIAEDAARQCGRTGVPIIHEPFFMNALFTQDSLFGSHLTDRKGLLFWEEEGTGLSKALDGLKGSGSIVIAVGPEGGFTREEVRLAESRGFLTASLGKRILRAETAAVSAMAIVQFSLGDIGDKPGTLRQEHG